MESFYVLFSFKSAEAHQLCLNGNLLLRLNLEVFDYKVVTTGTSLDAGDSSSADEAREAPSPRPSQPPTPQSPSQNIWNDLLAVPRPNTPSL